MFKPTHEFHSSPQETNPEDGDAEQPEARRSPTSSLSQSFELNEFVGHSRSQRRGFKFDSEHARNFEEGNVKKARMGVKEIFADAMERIRAEAEKIRAQAREEGHREGYQAGFQAGEEAARQEFTPFLEGLQDLIANLSALRQTQFPKMEREMIEMITDICKKVIEVELSRKEDSIQNIVRLAVQSILDRESLRIKVHPDDYQHAENYRPELIKMFQDIRSLKIEGHESVERGHCVVDSNFGTIHAGIENLHQQIEKILHLAPPAASTEDKPEPPETS